MSYDWLYDPDNSYDIWRDEQLEKEEAEESDNFAYEDREQIQAETHEY